jgi:hypothetical protein
MAVQYIRIVATPPGEAPLWVREKWLGLCLPVADGRGARDAYVSGVLSGPRNRFLAFVWRFLGRLGRRSGYAVYVRDAVRELEKTAPDAAAWWKEDAARLQAPGRKFLFRTPDCEVVETGCEAGDQRALKPDVAPPLAGLSPVPQIPMRRAAGRVSFRLHRSPFAPALILALALVGGLWNWSHPTLPERQAVVHGNLIDWSLHRYNTRGGSHLTVHLRITGYSEEFRVDPGVFRDLMGDKLPPGFVNGAAIDITADAGQVAAPLHPLLKPSVAIVWVNGLAVNGVTAFALADVLRHERRQWTGWFALAVMAAAYLGITIAMSRKQAAAR